MLMLGMLVAVFVGDSKEAGAQTQPADSDAPKKLTVDLGNGVTLQLMRIPAGKFLMGSPETENDRKTDETQHEVTLSKPFYMGVTHVTVEQFAAFVKDKAYTTDAEADGSSTGIEIIGGRVQGGNMAGCSWRNPSFDQKRDYPVVQVSWKDAKAFCAWLSRKSGKTAALPTEAQWEYACRAGTTTTYPWGDNPDDGNGWANCADQSIKKNVPNAPASWTFFNWDDGFVFTSPVANFKANAFGLHDMIGNAWEWCSDGYGDYDNSAVTDPTGANLGTDRLVLRGGSWEWGPASCRSASRSWEGPSSRGPDIGFRVVVAAGVN
jgi:formylglycine-generating enzyme required for sulfatase activity